MSPAGNATLGDYAWAEDLMAFTVTFPLHAGTIEDAFRATGMAWTPTRPTRFAETDFDPRREPLLVDRLGEWLVLLAPNGFQFSLPDVAAAVSRVGRVVSVSWNVNAVMRVLVADAGRITRRFDPLIYGDADGGPLPEEAELPFDDAGQPLHAASLVFAERLTGQRLTLDWVLGEHEAVLLHR